MGSGSGRRGNQRVLLRSHSNRRNRRERSRTETSSDGDRELEEGFGGFSVRDGPGAEGDERDEGGGIGVHLAAGGEEPDAGADGGVGALEREVGSGVHFVLGSVSSPGEELADGEGGRDLADDRLGELRRAEFGEVCRPFGECFCFYQRQV